jgi:hypothetical protein
MQTQVTRAEFLQLESRFAQHFQTLAQSIQQMLAATHSSHPPSGVATTATSTTITSLTDSIDGSLPSNPYTQPSGSLPSTQYTPSSARPPGGMITGPTP